MSSSAPDKSDNDSTFLLVDFLLSKVDSNLEALRWPSISINLLDISYSSSVDGLVLNGESSVTSSELFPEEIFANKLIHEIMILFCIILITKQ